MVRLEDSTHGKLTEIGRYQDTIDQIVNRLIKYYSFNEILEILNQRDKEIIPTHFIEELCKLDQDAIQNGKPSEFMAEELWTSLGGFNMEKVYPLVEYYFLNFHNCIVKHPDGKISLTNAGRKCCGQQFVLPDVFKPSAMR